MRSFKIRVVLLFLLWGVVLGIGHVLTIADSRIYQTGTFLLTVAVVFFGDTYWRRRKAKKLEKLDLQ